MEENKIIYSTADIEEAAKEEFSTLGLWKNEEGEWEIQPFLL